MVGGGCGGLVSREPERLGAGCVLKRWAEGYCGNGEGAECRRHRSCRLWWQLRDGAKGRGMVLLFSLLRRSIGVYCSGCAAGMLPCVCLSAQGLSVCCRDRWACLEVEGCCMCGALQRQQLLHPTGRVSCRASLQPLCPWLHQVVVGVGVIHLWQGPVAVPAYCCCCCCSCAALP